jgi:catechol 2,3-dioxygenase-like lactoylglutathione lyase family enzyme
VLGFRVLYKWPTTALVGRGNIKLGFFSRPNGRVRSNTDKDIVIQHVAFLVDGLNFDAARRNLVDKGVVMEEQDNGIGDCIFFCDPDGHLLEFITYHPESPSFPDSHGHANVPQCPCTREL